VAAQTKKAGSAFPTPHHNHKACSSEALARAEEVCEAKDTRLTDIRKRVLKAIWLSHKPVGAYDLLKIIGKDTARLAPTTIYRAIDFLMENGLVHRLASLNAYVGCPHPESDHAPQFMICSDCGTAAELEEDAASKLLVRAAAANGFKVRSQVVELSGTCSHCSK